MNTDAFDVDKCVEEALCDKAALDNAIESLSVGSRRGRQQAARIVCGVAKKRPDVLVDYIDALVDALERPEAQTRWECLDALYCLVALTPQACAAAIPGAETALFDEDSGLLRLAAMRFLCAFGSTDEERSNLVWPLIDEGIQCCHGDSEFQDMLLALIDFSKGNISDDVKSALNSRMSFDASNSRGLLKRRAAQIVENTSLEN